MGPYVAAALISAIALTLVNAASISASTSTSKRAREADRLGRLWEKRVEVYVDIVTFVIDRRSRRDDTRAGAMGSGESLSDSADDYLEQSSLALRGRLEALASSDVMAAFNSALTTYRAVQATRLERAPLDAIRNARIDANKADDILLESIRRELNPDATRRPPHPTR